MALAKRTSRPIVVDGHAYRWAVAPDSGCLWLVIEHAELPGQRVEAVFDYRDGTPGEGAGSRQRRSVTPRTVRGVVLHALAVGWQAGRRGAKALRVDGDAVVPPDELPCDAARPPGELRAGSSG